jgi:hypothetical protein
LSSWTESKQTALSLSIGTNSLKDTEVRMITKLSKTKLMRRGKEVWELKNMLEKSIISMKKI